MLTLYRAPRRVTPHLFLKLRNLIADYSTQEKVRGKNKNKKQNGSTAALVGAHE